MKIIVTMPDMTNREIKFRAWDTETKVMVNGLALDFRGEILVTKKRGPDGKYSFKKQSGYDRERYTIMQFTGLHDKNGNEIYEGDVLRWNDSRNLEVRWGTVGWVLWSDLFKSFGHPVGDTCSEFNTTGYTRISEIIGNIYENPELIEN